DPTPQPTVDGTLISGLMRIDASYVIAAGGGNVIAAGGGNVIAAGGGNVIAAGGGNVIAAGGGNVIAAGGGNVIAAGGGNVIAAGGGNYRVLDASACSDTQTLPTSPTASLDPKHVPPGTILPASGTVVVPVSLKTGKVLGPAVFTDSTGHYTVTVPKGTESDVMLVAGVPGKSASDPLVTDPRLQYTVLAAMSASGTPEIDEDTATLTRYLRSTMRARLDALLQPALIASSASDTALLKIPNIPPAEQTVINAYADVLRNEVKSAPFFTGVEKTDTPHVLQLAQRISDSLVAQIDLNKVNLDPAMAKGWTMASANSNQGVMKLMLDEMRLIRGAADAKLAENPHYFDDKPYITAANLSLPAGAAQYQILKGSDLCDFIVNYYYASSDAKFGLTSRAVIEDLGLACDDTTADQVYYEIWGCANSILEKMLPLLTTDQKDISTTIQSFTPSP
ncbi:MAG TPA: hypothetical protein V6D47_12980, partial [Oscillatoriaceae cyanobacterium]